MYCIVLNDVDFYFTAKHFNLHKNVSAIRNYVVCLCLRYDLNCFTLQLF